MVKKKGMNGGLKITLIVTGLIVLLFIGLVTYYRISPLKNNFYPDNKVVMYGYKNYSDYLENRPVKIAEIDDEFIRAVTDSTNKENASIQVVQFGWNFLAAGDTSTAMKRFNQAWLLNQNNFNVYWGFAATLSQEAITTESEEKLNEAISMFNHALDLYKDSDKINPQDKITLLCDFGATYILRASEKEMYFLDSSINLTSEAINSASKEEPFLNATARCAYTEAQAWYYKTDYAKSWERIKLARQLNPGGFNSDGEFIVELSKQMSEP